LMNAPVLQGGPVHTERGFVLHDAMWVARPKPAATDDTAATDLGAQEAQEAQAEAQALSEVSSHAADNDK
ncbi:MAG: hypothetical protein ACOVKR_05150, partial [Limnohabitans sp.]